MTARKRSAPDLLSTDDLAEIADETTPKYNVGHKTNNRGRGGGQKSGMWHVRMPKWKRQLKSIQGHQQKRDL
jgi:hypothetical protein